MYSAMWQITYHLFMKHKLNWLQITMNCPLIELSTTVETADQGWLLTITISFNTQHLQYFYTLTLQRLPVAKMTLTGLKKTPNYNGQTYALQNIL